MFYGALPLRYEGLIFVFDVFDAFDFVNTKR